MPQWANNMQPRTIQPGSKTLIANCPKRCPPPPEPANPRPMALLSAHLSALLLFLLLLFPLLAMPTPFLPSASAMVRHDAGLPTPTGNFF